MTWSEYQVMLSYPATQRKGWVRATSLADARWRANRRWGESIVGAIQRVRP